jgi:hypothetical protein
LCQLDLAMAPLGLLRRIARTPVSSSPSFATRCGAYCMITFQAQIAASGGFRQEKLDLNSTYCSAAGLTLDGEGLCSARTVRPK